MLVNSILASSAPPLPSLSGIVCSLSSPSSMLLAQKRLRVLGSGQGGLTWDDVAWEAPEVAPSDSGAEAVEPAGPAEASGYSCQLVVSLKASSLDSTSLPQAVGMDDGSAPGPSTSVSWVWGEY